jgi:hypothetical protein
MRNATRQPVPIIGAGPYGLSVAAHLRERSIETRIFGEPLGAWRRHMPKRMLLKSTASASSLSSPRPGYRLQDFCAETGADPVDDRHPVSRDLFVRYGLWFQEQLVPDVERVAVEHISVNGGGFRLRLGSGEMVTSPALVLATGHVAFAHVPSLLRALTREGPAPDAPVSHSSQHDDLDRFADRDVAVIGAGQSALETAALLHEAGARPHLLARSSRLLWADPPDVSTNGLRRRIPKPESDLGPGFSLYAVSRGPTLVSRLPSRSRLMLVKRILGPSGAWWLRDRFVGVIDARIGWRLESAALSDGRLLLRGWTPTQKRDELEVDHVIAATGYRVDVDALTFLDAHLRAQVRRVAGWPSLTRSFESSVDGLFFTGLSAAATFGPLMRFVAGTAFAARRVSAALAAESERR